MSLEDLEKMNDHILQSTKEAWIEYEEDEISTRFIAYWEFPDTFVYPRNHYMASLIYTL